ncbi:hypothetical protein MPTK1_4g09630 [Marchantia polymorpha subsp. ruderalis]|uniref:Uncharacterized protein n=2 Tax=Marchantia polymorpha TaxID=3197 RepID=A0AAF6B862_MARPO|nr:hypothetical protein MARPO_0132s0006 [Marchantia polymorpha]BBN08196.1 hypothetical protein Mp_4g09630 [Marchantia polymorpha subsp. ruderalis]|eukprot:PTQ29926.1 hypothetical protein MARPO_0132s0006 [Marchantia polymorpha]
MLQHSELPSSRIGRMQLFSGQRRTESPKNHETRELAPSTGVFAQVSRDKLVAGVILYLANALGVTFSAPTSQHAFDARRFFLPIQHSIFSA